VESHVKPLLVNIRGTCGAGKSHIVHEVRRKRTMIPVFEQGRRRPAGYTSDGLFIVGHYEIAIGGIDTFKTLDDAYDVIDRWGKTRNVLCEGKAQNRDIAYRIGRQHGFRVVCINLTTSPEIAIASVRRRGHNISEQIINRTYRKCQRDAEALRAAGITVYDSSREGAMKLVRELLG
jgi:hypothetical protein